jgi:hypothetical protein
MKLNKDDRREEDLSLKALAVFFIIGLAITLVSSLVLFNL